jgi:hypothetical protein
VIIMSHLSRRSVLLAVPATTVSLAATGAVASAAPTHQAAPNIITFTSRRVQATLPNLTPVAPALGTTFIAYLKLLDDAGKPIGDGSVSGAVVDIIAGIPVKLVTQVSVIFRLTDGEIHASNMHIRLIPNPGVLHLIAITGGTGAYRTARGSGTIEHVTDTDTTVVLNVLVDQPAGSP